MHRVRISLLVATVLGAPLRAFAEEPKEYPECTHQASEADLTAAKAAFQAGNVSFNEADYPRAILYWEDAFRRDCSANALLLNLARAYELNAQKRQAVVALETYLKREQSSEETAQITRRIEVLKKQLDDEARAQAKAAPPPAPTSAPPAPSPPPAAETAPPPATEGRRPIVPLVVAGVGGVMTIVGAGLYFKAASDVDEYASHCEDPDTRSGCPDGEVDDANSARSRQIVGGVVAGVGIPVLAGGLIWYFLSPPTTTAGKAAPSQRARVTPAVGAGFVGVAVDGRF